MKSKIKKFINSKLFIFIITAIVFSTIGVSAATYFPSNDVIYDNSTSGLESTDVQGAIDELYGVCFPPTGSDVIADLLPSIPNELYKDDYDNIRYYGKAPNNYVRFNDEYWRIIGIIDGKIKIISDESFENKTWNSTMNNNWKESSLKNYLNDTYYNKIKEPYKEMISEETYYLGGPVGSDIPKLTASMFYNVEKSNSIYSGNPTSIRQYIGLMYPSDYGYAAGNDCLLTPLFNYNEKCKNNDWLYNEADEWLQTPRSDGYDGSMTIFAEGYVRYGSQVMHSYMIRPVLFLSSQVKITSGNGSYAKPYELSI